MGKTGAGHLPSLSSRRKKIRKKKVEDAGAHERVYAAEKEKGTKKKKKKKQTFWKKETMPEGRERKGKTLRKKRGEKTGKVSKEPPRGLGEEESSKKKKKEEKEDQTQRLNSCTSLCPAGTKRKKNGEKKKKKKGRGAQQATFAAKSDRPARWHEGKKERKKARKKKREVGKNDRTLFCPYSAQLGGISKKKRKGALVLSSKMKRGMEKSALRAQTSKRRGKGP